MRATAVRQLVGSARLRVTVQAGNFLPELPASLGMRLVCLSNYRGSTWSYVSP